MPNPIATIPDWLLGPHLTDVTITPLTVLLGGILTPGVAASVVAQTNSIEPELVTENSDIRPVTRKQMNNVNTGEGYGLRLEVIQQRGTVTAITQMVTGGIKHVMVTFVQGIEGYIAYFLITGWTGGVRARDMNPATLTLAPIDVGDDVGQFRLVPQGG